MVLCEHLGRKEGDCQSRVLLALGRNKEHYDNLSLGKYLLSVSHPTVVQGRHTGEVNEKDQPHGWGEWVGARYGSRYCLFQFRMKERR